MTQRLDAFPSSPLVLDASAIINLLGCGRSANVLAAINTPCWVEERTLAEIRHHPMPHLCHKSALNELMGHGLLLSHRMTDDEYDVYLSLVSGMPESCLGDGESAAMAVAALQGHAVILDDGKARRIHRERFPSVPMASSLRFFLAAGQRENWTNEAIRGVVRSARDVSRMGAVKEERKLMESYL